MVDPQQLLQAGLALLACYGAFGDRLVQLLQEWKKIRVQPDNTASDYFDDLGNALANVYTELAAKRVPRIDGTRLNTLLQSFELKTAAVRGEKVAPSLQKILVAAADGAKTLDAWALDRIELDEEHKAQLLAQIERAAGTCKALATILKCVA